MDITEEIVKPIPYIGPKKYIMKTNPNGGATIIQAPKETLISMLDDGSGVVKMEEKKEEEEKKPLLDSFMKDFIPTKKPLRNYYICTNHDIPSNSAFKPVTLIVAKNIQDAQKLLDLKLYSLNLLTSHSKSCHLEPMPLEGPLCSIISPFGLPDIKMEEEENLLLPLSMYYEQQHTIYDKGTLDKQRSIYICQDHASRGNIPGISICFALDEIEAKYLLDQQLYKKGLLLSSQKNPTIKRILLEEGVMMLSMST